jgi:large subunit ribosomal protein L15
MKLESLKPASGSNKAGRRIARGEGSGSGDTAGRGHKGDGSRAGSRTKRHFEGGQMPLHMRIPKRGFKNFNRVEYVPFNLSAIEILAEKLGVDTLTLEHFQSERIITGEKRIKILAKGELTRKVSVTAHAFSGSAKQAIEDKGGVATTA